MNPATKNVVLRLPMDADEPGIGATRGRILTVMATVAADKMHYPNIRDIYVWFDTIPIPPAAQEEESHTLSIALLEDLKRQHGKLGEAMMRFEKHLKDKETEISRLSEALKEKDEQNKKLNNELGNVLMGLEQDLEGKKTETSRLSEALKEKEKETDRLSRALEEERTERQSRQISEENPEGPGRELRQTLRRSESLVSYDSSEDGELEEPGFAYIDGEVGGSGYNETNVDIVAVPCPGADPLRPWIGSEPFPEGYFSPPQNTDGLSKHPALKELAGDAILSPGINMNLPKAAHAWVRQGIRKSASTARVLLYRHRSLSEGVTLESLAEDLMEHVMRMREGLHPSRPLIFVAHSIGGLVVKILLTRAGKIPRYRTVRYNCHGVAFFATPHRGSSYLSMKNLSESIRDLLHLERPLPRSIADELRLGHKSLLKLNDDFRDISSELRIWTFYETIDSQLSGSGSGLKREVQFGAPLASIKSSILDIWQEDVFALDSDHANCASFGTQNPRTLAAFLEDFSAAITKAEELSSLYTHHPMLLRDNVKLDLIGFYEDPDAEMDIDSDLRLYFTKVSVTHFLARGPERCLEERLKIKGHQSQAHEPRPGTASSAGGKIGLGILSSVQSILRHPATEETQTQPSERPDIVVSQPARPSASTGVISNSMPAVVMRGLHSLAVPHGSREQDRPSSRGSNTSEASTTHSEPIPAIPDGGDRESLRRAPLRRRSDEFNRLAFQDMAGFSRPDPKLRKFMWMHLPFTNPLWVKEIFDKVSEAHVQNFTRLYNNESWISRQVQGHPSQSQPNYVKPACNYIRADAAHSPRSSPTPSGRSPATNHSPSYLNVYMPYLHFDTYTNIIRRRNLIKRRLDHGRAGPVPREIAELDSLEMKVIWEYIGADPPLNIRRTLDQFGYPSLEDTYARDDDQMLYKLTKKQPAKPPSSASAKPAPQRSDTFASKLSSMVSREDEEGSSDSESSADEEEEAKLKEGNVLMPTANLVTFFPKRESSPKEGTLFQQADLRNSVYNELNGDLTGRTDNALDLAAFITENMTTSLKEFRTQTYKDLVTNLSSYASDDEITENTTSIKRRYKHELERAQRENRENTSALLELRDMEDELTTLSRLFESQEHVIKTMLDIYSSPTHKLTGLTSHGRGYLHLALRHLEGYKTTAAEMRQRVDTTRKDYEKLLEMAQRQAQVDDVRWSRIQTELASSQNLSVMIFTTFTVIFLPLSFFTGLFGMNTSEWQEDRVPSLSFIGSISLPVSTFLIVGSLVAAFSERVQGWFFYLLRHWRRVVGWWAGRVAKMTPRRLGDRKRRRAEERERKIRREERRRRERRGYDFWASVRGRRGEGYEIPGMNRRGTGVSGT
ncbi:hypothetical protein GE09DRAFT_1201888 [Coniochaeta sp. 2T2.1]|nr:hypothetical protein GE09DRAFT_1201888 [Coniochaeta sp. 2T2.1]